MVYRESMLGAWRSCTSLCSKSAHDRPVLSGLAQPLTHRSNSKGTLHYSQRRYQHEGRPIKTAAAKPAGGKAAREAERDLFLSVLSATTTKRDAKSYLSRFRTSAPGKTSSNPREASAAPWPVSIALVKIRALQSLDEPMLQGIAHTLSQLNRLGLSPVVVVDCEVDDTTTGSEGPSGWKEELAEQADRMVAALQRENSSRASRLDYVMGSTAKSAEGDATTAVQGSVRVQHPDVLIGLLKRRNIPVIPPISYTIESQRMQKVASDDVVLALTRQFAGLNRLGDAKEHGEQTAKDTNSSMKLEKIVLLDPLGGLPSAQRPDSAHVFINLDQEYEDVREELLSAHATKPYDTIALQKQAKDEGTFELLTASSSQTKTSSASPQEPVVTNRNVKNLDLLRKALALLPPSASAMLTTPAQAATITNVDKPASVDLGVITRRPRNPLIYNLLTDKSLVSSSLPAARLDMSVLEGSQITPQPNSATFVKRGMPLTIIPDPRHNAWEPPRPDRAPLRLDDPKIDLSRLINLIEDSFNRPLNVEHYMKRIRNNLAGVIVAGEYEGGAILTWELPPGVPDDGSEESRRRMVPYLDKFAVLKRSQGAGGVADIVFSAMVRSCFPQGVCWRSRKDNPVNKWYFERSAGTLKIPETNWTSFWTTENVYDDQELFRDYVGVCRGDTFEPSWADLHKKAAD